MSARSRNGPPKRSRIKGSAEKKQAGGQEQKQANAEVCDPSDPLFESLGWETNKFVVNVRKDTPDVYVGRKNPRFSPESCDNYKWGNPFKDQNQTKEDRCRQYQNYLYGNEKLKQEAKRELKGKRLGCWCYPLMCHAMFLAKVANEE